MFPNLFPQALIGQAFQQRSAVEEMHRAQLRAQQNAFSQTDAEFRKALACAGGNVVPIREPEPVEEKLRTPEEIEEQLEARYEELCQQAANVPPASCANCRFLSNRGSDGYRWSQREHILEYGSCSNALVKGFAPYGPTASSTPALCGPEKALWEPRFTRWQRFCLWLYRLFNYE